MYFPLDSFQIIDKNFFSVDQWISTKIINLWGRRKPDVDSKSAMSMATKWSGYECRDTNDDTVRLVRMTDAAILVEEHIIKEYAIKMPDNPVSTYGQKLLKLRELIFISDLSYNSLTPRARKTSAVDTLIDKFPFYRHVFRKHKNPFITRLSLNRFCSFESCREI